MNGLNVYASIINSQWQYNDYDSTSHIKDIPDVLPDGQTFVDYMRGIAAGIDNQVRAAMAANPGSDYPSSYINFYGNAGVPNLWYTAMSLYAGGVLRKALFAGLSQIATDMTNWSLAAHSVTLSLADVTDFKKDTWTPEAEQYHAANEHHVKHHMKKAFAAFTQEHGVEHPHAKLAA